MTPLETAHAVARWQLANLDGKTIRKPNSQTTQPWQWQQATFYAALAQLPGYKEELKAYAASIDNRLNGDIYHADCQLAGVALVHAGYAGTVQDQLREIMRRPSTARLVWDDPRCQTRWCWCDALFMALPLWMEIGDDDMRDFALCEAKETTDFLRDPATGFFYRDSRFFNNPIFWGRGNGWVLSAFAQLAARGQAPDWMQSALFNLIEAVIDAQLPSGGWAMGLNDPADQQVETSATALIVHGLATASRTFDGAYDDAARRGWAALQANIEPDGKPIWVQQVNKEPGELERDDTQFYGSGAVILAALAVAQLDSIRSADNG